MPPLNSENQTGFVMNTPRQRSVTGIFYSICFAQFIIPYMVSSVSLALPSIGRDLHATAMQLGFVEQFYLIAMAMTLLTFGRLGDLLGRGRVYACGFVVFTICSAAIGFMTDITALLVVRCIQGVGAAGLLSISMALVTSLFPPEERGRRFGILSGFIYAGLSAGPFLGGAIVTNLGWRSVFWTVGPVAGIISIFCLMRMWNERGNASGESLDYKGSLLYGASFALFIIGASRIIMPFGWLIFLLGVIGFFIFYHIEKKTKMPLLDVILLKKNRLLSFGLIAAMGNYASICGVTFFVSLYLQYVQGLSPQITGIIMLVQPIAQVIVSPLAGRVIDRNKIGKEKLANIGIGLTGISLLCMALTAGRNFSLYVIPFELLFIGIGYGAFIVPNTVIVMGSVEKKQLGLASSLVAVMRNLGMVISMTCVTIIFSIFMASQAVTPETIPTFLLTMRISLVVCTFFALMGFVSSFARGKQHRPVSSEGD